MDLSFPGAAARGSVGKRTKSYGLIGIIDVNEVIAEEVQTDKAVCARQSGGGNNVNGTVAVLY